MKTLICPCCKTAHSNVGLNRRSKVCPTCYIKYRQLYNLLESSKYRAKQNNLEFDLTLEWLLEQTKTNLCKKTGIELTYDQNGKNYSNRKPTTASIDKINPSLGYTQDNCQVVCWWYNMSKQRFTDDEVYNLCLAVITTYQKNAAQVVQQ